VNETPFWLMGTLLGALALLTTLRLSIPRTASAKPGMVSRLLTYPGWLLPMIPLMATAVGLMMRGLLSPWPPTAAARFSQHGLWAGVFGFLLALVVDLWLLWTAARVVKRFAPPEKQYALRNLPVFNFLVGGAILVAAALINR
jgi:hypothetical protein